MATQRVFFWRERKPLPNKLGDLLNDGVTCEPVRGLALLYEPFATTSSRRILRGLPWIDRVKPGSLKGTPVLVSTSA